MSRLSVIIPTYNRAHLVGEAIESVLAQTRPVHEIIVVDDGSTDSTSAALSHYGNQICLIRQPNAGPSAARNRGLREARGDLICFLDSDDLWVPSKTELQMDFLTGNPGVEFVFGNMANFADRAGNDSPEIKKPVIHDYLVRHATNLDRLFEWLIVENFIPTPTVMLRRSSVEKVGFFDETMTQAEDFDYWLRAARLLRSGYVDEVLIKRRRHEGNLVNDWVARESAHAQVLANIVKIDPDLPERFRKLVRLRLDELHYDIASHYLKNRNFEDAFHHLVTCSPGKMLDSKWLMKFVAASLLRHFPRTSAVTNPLDRGGLLGNSERNKGLAVPRN